MTIPDGRRILKKIRGMDRRELADRCRQEFAKRADSVLSALDFNFTRNALSSHARREGRFFFSPGQIEAILEELQRRLPQKVAEIVDRADRILAHRFDLLGFEGLDYGPSINWHLDIVHSKQAPPDTPFYKVKYLSFEEVGDSKITWELNRHQHLVTLAKAYRFTRDRRYADEIFAQWSDWHRANSYPRGINWASSLEVGFRSLSWMWVYYLLEGTEAMPPGFRREWLLSQARNGRHLERYLSTYFSPNTHLLGEGVALFFLGTLCRELADADRWRDLGWNIVTKESRRQVNQDGLHFEQSTYYHVYALDFFLHSLILASVNEQAIPAEMERVIVKMLDALSLLSLAGSPPRFGDDDGGRLFDSTRNRTEHLIDPLAVGSVLFGRADLKAQARELTEEAIWLTGAEGVERWDRFEARAPARRSSALSEAGVFMMNCDATQLFIDGGTATAQSRGHDHADALSVCLYTHGRPLLIDPGTFEYVGPTPKRNLYRGTSMHNTLRIDGCDQADPDGPFSWKQHFQTRADQWIPGETFDLFVGSHDGYTRLPSPVVHQRWVVALRSGLFLVRDVAQGSGKHQIGISWHLSPDLQTHSGEIFRFKDSDHGLAILAAQGHGWTQESQKGSWSPVYGRESDSVIVNFGAFGDLPAEFATVLAPLGDGRALPGTLTRREHRESGLVQAYRYESTGGRDEFFFARSGSSWSTGQVSSDAEFVCISHRADWKNPDIVFCNGSFVEIAGGQSARTKGKVQRLEVTHRGVFCSDSDAIDASIVKNPG
jgi:hypothetical protein